MVVPRVRSTAAVGFRLLRLRRRLGLLAAVPLIALPLCAQAPEERAALVAWLDTLDAVPDLPMLERLDAASRRGEGVPGALRRAHYVLRRGELRNDRSEIDAALFDFQTAATRRGQWPWPRYALARAIVALELREFVPRPGNGIREGESHASAIWRMMQESRERDPLFGPSRDLFLQLALASGYRDPRDDFRRTILGYAAPPTNDWRAVLVEGRMLVTAGDPEAALARFDSVLVLGGDSSLVQLDRARVLHRLGQATAARDAYWASARHPSAAARLEHRIDLQWITSPDTLERFAALPVDSVLPWLQRFWLKRDAENLRVPGERLTEHLRRWNLVRELYRIPAASRRTEMKRTEFDVALQGECVPSGAWSLDDLIAEEPHHPGDIRKDERFLDHRAIVYLRHGEPTAKSIVGGGRSDVDRSPQAPGMHTVSDADVSWFLPPVSGNDAGTRAAALDNVRRFLNDSLLFFSRSLTAEQLMDERVRQNESWLYWVEGRYRVLHFTGSQALGLHAPTTLNAILPLRPDLYAARGNLFWAYVEAAQTMLRPPGARPLTCNEAIQQAMSQSRADATVSAQADSYTPVFDSAFTLYTQFFGVGHGADGSGRAVVAFAIPNTGLRSQGNTPDGRLLVPIRFRLTFFDPATGNNRFIDTTRTFATRSLDTGFLAGLFEVPLGAGDWMMGLRAEQPGHGTGGMARLRGVTIPGTSGLALGDLVVGRASGIPQWTPAGVESIPLNPFNAWPTGSDLELWYQVRGLAAGTEFRSRIEAAPVSRGRRGVQIEATERSSGPVTTLRRTLTLRGLAPGEYLIRITAISAGVTATRERAVSVVE